MNSCMYDRMLAEYSKKTKEELVQKIMALEEIECKDRGFANQCQAGTPIYDINVLFAALEDMQTCFTYEKANKVYELMQRAKSSWKYIQSGLAEMSDNTRCSKALDNFKLRKTNLCGEYNYDQSSRNNSRY